MRPAYRLVHEVKWPLLMCSVKILGKFVFGNVLAEDYFFLVWVVERW